MGGGEVGREVWLEALEPGDGHHDSKPMLGVVFSGAGRLL